MSKVEIGKLLEKIKGYSSQSDGALKNLINQDTVTEFVAQARTSKLVNEEDVDAAAALLSFLSSLFLGNSQQASPRISVDDLNRELLENENNGELIKLREAAAEQLIKLLIDSLLPDVNSEFDSEDGIACLREIANVKNNEELFGVLSKHEGFKDVVIRNQNFNDDFAGRVANLARGEFSILIQQFASQCSGHAADITKEIFDQRSTHPEVKTDADLESEIRTKVQSNNDTLNFPKESIEQVVQEIKSSVKDAFEEELKLRALTWNRDAAGPEDTFVSKCLENARTMLESAQSNLSEYEIDASYIEAKNRKEHPYRTGNYLADAVNVGLFRGMVGYVSPQQVETLVLHHDSLKKIRDSAERDVAFFETQLNDIKWQKIVASNVHSRVNLDQGGEESRESVDYKKLRSEYETLNRAEDVTEKALYATVVKLVRNAAISAAAEGLSEVDTIEYINNSNIVAEPNLNLSTEAFNALLHTVLLFNKEEISKARAVALSAGLPVPDEDKLAARAAAEELDLSADEQLIIKGRIVALKATALSEDDVRVALVAAGLSDIAPQVGGDSPVQKVLTETAFARESIRASIRDISWSADLHANANANANAELEGDSNNAVRANAIQRHIHLQDTIAAVLIREPTKTGYIRDPYAVFKTSIARGVTDLDAEVERLIGALKPKSSDEQPAPVSTASKEEKVVFERAALKSPRDYKFTCGPLERGALCLAEDIHGTIHGLSSISHLAPTNAGEKQQYENDLVKEAYTHAMKRFEIHKPGEPIIIFCKGQHDARAAMRLHAALLVVAQDLGIKNLQIKQMVSGCVGPEKGYFSDGSKAFIQEHLGKLSKIDFTGNREAFKDRMQLLKEKKTIEKNGKEGDIIDLTSPRPRT